MNITNTNTTNVKLLQVASEIAGGSKALAARLGINEALLLRIIAERRPLPDPLLFKALDIILADRESGPQLALHVAEPLQDDR
jgi:hypothetical protein